MNDARRGEVVLWGTGTPKREFLHSDDFADAVLFLIENYSRDKLINVGVGKEISINELTNILVELTSFQGEITDDTSKPDGTPSKGLDVSKLKVLGWKPNISLRDGLEQTVEEFKKIYNISIRIIKSRFIY